MAGKATPMIEVSRMTMNCAAQRSASAHHLRWSGMVVCMMSVPSKGRVPPGEFYRFPRGHPHGSANPTVSQAWKVKRLVQGIL